MHQKSRCLKLHRIVFFIFPLALLHIFLAPLKEGNRGKEPIKTVILYSEDGAQNVKRVVKPGDFWEQAVAGPIQVEMTFEVCQPIDRYRFFVGPHAEDSTLRQPSIWRVYVSAEDGNWVEADDQQWGEKYRNNWWYSFPLRNVPVCVNRVRLEIEKLSGYNILRVYKFQLFKALL